MLKFDPSEKEAKEELAKLKKKEFTKFCPLLLTKCNNKCVCFKEAELILEARSNMPSSPIYSVIPKRCNNWMFLSG